MRNPRADDLIGAMLNKQIADIGTHFKSDVLTIKAPIRFGLDDAVRHEIENLADNKGKRADKLTVIIQTTGGYIEVVERIYNVFRKHYKTVDFVVPNYLVTSTGAAFHVKYAQYEMASQSINLIAIDCLNYTIWNV